LELAAFSQTGDEINNGVLRVQMTEQADSRSADFNLCRHASDAKSAWDVFCVSHCLGTPTYQQERPDIAEQVLQLAAEIESLHKTIATATPIALPRCSMRVVS